MSRRGWKLGSAALAVAVLCGVVTAGFASAKPAGKLGAAAGTLNIYGYGPGDDVQENRADYAKSRLPNTDVKRPAGDFNDQSFLTRLASGDVPDLVRMGRPRVAQYAAKGVLREMDSCIPKAVRAQYRAGAMKAMTYKGHVYGVPEFTNQVTLIVNQSAFKASGVPISAAQTKNWKQLLATAKKLTKRNASGDLTRIGFDPKIPEFFPMWVKWFGKDIISNNGLTAQLNSKEAIAALTFTNSIIKAEGGWNKFKAFRDTIDWFGKEGPLVKDQIGFTPYESFIYNVFSNNSPNVDLVAKFFTNRRGGPVTMFSGNGWVVPKASKNPNDACAYMKAVTSVPAWMDAAKKRYDARKRTGATFTGIYTANTLADKKSYEDVYQSFGKPQFDRAVQLLVAAPKYGFELPPSPAGQQVLDAMNAAINRVLAGQQSPKAALNQAQKEAQKAINDNK